MKALEKDRDRRYETASAFAADVQRYLQDEPVQACPPSAWYRLGKFTRRNKIRLVLAACAVTLVFGLASSAVWLAVRLRETEWGVTAALTQAKALLKVGDKQTDYPERWQATTRLALAAVEKAEGLLAAGVATEELAAQVRQVRAAVDAAGRDSRLLMALERIRLAQAVVNVKESCFDNGRAHPFYANALKEYGVGLATPEAAAARVRESRLREALLSALADWERVSQDGGERQRVAEVYKLALPRDSLQERLRAAIRRRDLREVSKLAQAPDLPLVSLAINAKALAGMKEWAAAELLLRAGLERNPGDFWLNHELGRLLQDQQPPRAEEAVRYLTAALALRPNSPGVRLNLGLALHYKGDVKGAIRCYRAALLISPKDTNAHLSQSETYRMDEAIAECRVAIQVLKNFPEDHNNLGIALAEKAIAEHREAIRIKKASPGAYVAHNIRGILLHGKGRLDEAITEYREAIRVEKDFPEAHLHLGLALYHKGRVDEAIAEYREAFRLKKDNAGAHDILGSILRDAKCDYDGAIAEFRESIRLKKDIPEVHNNLGIALYRKGQLDEAIAEHREAIRLQKDYAEAYRNLGHTLQQKGEFREALEALRRSHELGSKRPHWPYPSAQWVRNGERLVELDGKLPALLSGQKQPADAAERLALAQLCQMPCKKQYAAAVRFYHEAFAAEPKLTGGQPSVHRYNAACAAALAGCGQGVDADKLDSQERARLRQQGLDWLQADLNAYRQMLEKSQGKAGPTIAKQMQHWLQDDDFAGVRSTDALARLPKAERQEWEKLWQEVNALRQRAAERPAAASSARP